MLAAIEQALNWVMSAKADKGMHVVSGRTSGIKSVTFI